MRQIASILVLGFLALLAFVAMALYGTTKNPRLLLKAALERASPVTVLGARIVDDPETGRRELIVRLGARDGGPVARGPLLAAAFATLAPTQTADSDLALPEFGWLTVEVEGDAPGAPTRTALYCDRFNLERWRDLEPRMSEMAQRLAPVLGSGATITIVPALGELDIEVRPTRAGLAPLAVAHAATALARDFPRIVVIGPGAAPVTVLLDDAVHASGR